MQPLVCHLWICVSLAWKIRAVPWWQGLETAAVNGRLDQRQGFNDLHRLKLDGFMPFHMAMGHNLWLHFGVDEQPFVTYFDVYQGYMCKSDPHLDWPRDCNQDTASQVLRIGGLDAYPQV